MTIIPQAESTSVKGGHLKTTVPVVPDAPIGHFRLTLFGGKKGYLRQHPEPLQGARRSRPSKYAGATRTARRLTAAGLKTKTACGANATRVPDQAFERVGGFQPLGTANMGESGGVRCSRM